MVSAVTSAPRPRPANVFGLELGAGAGAGPSAAKHVLEDVVDAAEAAGAGAGASAAAAEAFRPPGEGLEVSFAAGSAAGARAGAGTGAETLEARLALGVDLAVVERLALIRIAEDLVGRVDLGELPRRLGVVLVGVGMQLLGKLPERLLDVVLARRPRHPQNLVGVAHVLHKLRLNVSRAFARFAARVCRLNVGRLSATCNG